MRIEYIEPFAEATRNVLESVNGMNARRGEISLEQQTDISGDVLVVVPLDGESPGNIVLNMDTGTALRIAAGMGSGDGRTLSPLTMDSIAELANMITGRATSLLNDMGFDLMVRPPIIVDRDQMSRRVQYVEVCRIPVETDCGVVTVSVALKND